MVKIKRDFLITILTVLIPVFLQFLYIRYVSYYVDKTVYGNFILLQTMIIALSYMFIQIPSQAYNRFFNTTEDKVYFINEFRTLLIGINILSFFIILLYGLIIKKFDSEILVLIFFYFAILNNYSFNQDVFLLKLERKKFFYLKIMESISKFLTPIIFYYYFNNLFGFVLGLVFGYALAFIILMQFMKDYKFKIVLNIQNLKKYLIFAYPILFTCIFSWGLTFSNRYFIEFYKSTEDVAIYSILAQVAGIGQIIGQVYMMYVNPKVLKGYEEDKENALLYLRKSIYTLFLIFTLLFIIVQFLPTSIYTILIEKMIIDNPYYLTTFYILILSTFFSILQTAYSLYFVLYKKLSILGYINFIAFCISIIGNFYIQNFGVIAAAVSTTIAYFIMFLLQVFYIKKLQLKESLK